MLRRGAVATALAILVSAVVGACSVGDLQFRNDHRLTFESPEARDNVELPVTIRWVMEDFAPVGLDGSSDGDRGAFAVFVDRAPMPVGKDLAWLARDLPGCTSNPECPTPDQLAQLDTYVTTEHSLALERLPEVSGRGKEQHWVNVVLVDGTGRRIGESAWYLPFTTDRRSSP